MRSVDGSIRKANWRGNTKKIVAKKIVGSALKLFEYESWVAFKPTTLTE